MPVDGVPTDATWSYDEAVIRRFEAAWRGPARPDLGAFLSPDLPDRERLLPELAHIDLEFRLRAGEPSRVEDYLTRFPELASKSIVLDLVATEFSVRNRYGDPVGPEEFLERFPAYRDDLAALLSLGAVTDTRTPERRKTAAPPPVGMPIIPGLEVVGELGRGGMGVVYQALQPALNRVVAVKTLATVTGVASADRFRREAETVARLDHPHIVPVYEVGSWAFGGVSIPYFVMKYYPGGSLDAVPSGPGTDPAAHAELVEVIARAVHHAHERGVLHRDLKPSNILLDDAGQPHVSDFGLAGWIDPDGPGSLSGAVVGTPAFMAPEQARGTDRSAPTTDVYGLGAILYQRLTGRPPFLAATPLATLELVTTAAPVRPTALNPRVPRDLETICLKCLQKDPGHRYGSAAELAEDLERQRAGLPIRARPTPIWEHGWRWARRNPMAALLALLNVLAVAAAIVVLAVSNARISKKEAETASALKRERESAQLLATSLTRERQALYLERISSAGRMYGLNQLPQAWQLLDLCPKDLCDWEWHYLDKLRENQPEPLGHHRSWVTAVTFLPGNRLATGDLNGEVRIWDLDRRVRVRTWEGRRSVSALAAHPEQPLLAVADELGVVVLDGDRGTPIHRIPGARHMATFSPDGEILAVAVGAAVRLLETVTWQPVGELVGHEAGVVAGSFHPGGGILATSGLDRTVRTWNVVTGAPLGPPRRRQFPVRELYYTADGEHLLEERTDGIVITESSTGDFRGAIDQGANRPGLAIGPNPQVIGVSGAHHEVLLWDLPNRRALRRFRGHTGLPTALAMSRDGRRVASGGGDNSVRVWDLGAQPENRSLGQVWHSYMSGLAVSPDGKRAAISPRGVGRLGEVGVRVLDCGSGRELLRIEGAGGVAFTPDGSRIVVGLLKGGVAVCNSEDGAVHWSQPMSGRMITRLVVSRDGRLVACGDMGGTVWVWETATGREIGSWSTGRNSIYALDFTRDGDRIVASSQDQCTMRTVADGKAVWTIKSGTMTLAVSPDGRRVATADRDRILRLRDVDTGKETARIHGSPSSFTGIAFDPSGRRIVVSDERSVRIVDVESARELMTLPGELGGVLGVAWVGPDVFALDGRIRIWEGKRVPSTPPE